MTINDIRFDPQQLMSRHELLDFLKENGESDRALSKIREIHFERFGNELIWRYPISDGLHLGTFIIAVKEGFISLPYDIVEQEKGELLELQDAKMFDLESMGYFIEDWHLFSDDLMGAMKDMRSILAEGRIVNA